MVRRPVTGTMVFIGISLLGLMSWFFTPRELFPSISFPQLQVITRYGNAAPEEIENLITKVIEESVGTVPNLKRVRSLSREGVSLVTLEFHWGTDMGFAHLAAREKLDQIKDRLPSESDDSVINRVNPFAQPLMIYSVSGTPPMRRLTEISKQVIKQRLEKVNGVASVTISGGQDREILVQVDRPRMESQGVSLAMIVDTLKDSNLNYPAGTVPGKFYEYIVRTMGEFENIDQIGRMPIRVDKPEENELLWARGPGADRNERRDLRGSQDQRLIRLESVAEVQDTFKPRTSYSRYNGEENISISIQKQAEANTLDTSDRTRRAMAELAAVLEPKGIKLTLVYDESVFIRDSVSGVAWSGFFGGVLAFLILYYFTKSWSLSTIVGLSIPVSTFITFVGMYAGNITINMLSLAGLGLGIGNMVDNSIVVAENIIRHRTELGKDLVRSAVDGTDEVAASMITSSLTNVAVLLPLLFAKGIAQLIFRDMFFIITSASFASVFISITLVPLMTAHPLSFGWLLAWRKKAGPRVSVKDVPPLARPGFFIRLTRWFLTGLTDEKLKTLMDFYRRGLNKVIDFPRATWLITLGISLLCFLPLSYQEKVFMPKVDQGQFLLRVEMPVGTRLEVTNAVAQRVERVLQVIPGYKNSTVNVGSNNAEATDALGDHQAQAVINLDRDAVSTDNFISILRAHLDREDLQGASVQYILQDSVLASAFETSAPIVIEVKGPDMATLKKMSEDIMEDIGKTRGVYGVKSSLALPSTETRVEIDKVRASSFQLSVAEIARTALIGIKGFTATTFKEAGQEVDVRVQLRPEDRVSMDAVGRLTVQTRDRLAVPLSEVALLRTAQGPSEVRHLDQQRAIVLTANIGQRSTREVLAEIQDRLSAYHEFADYQVDITGESRQMKESFGGLAVAMLLAIALVYMFMAAEFESLWHPLIIMITVPFSAVGVALSLVLTHTAISAPVILGMILLSGSVVNYGIVLIDFVNLRRREGIPLKEAVVEGSVTRLRPVLMSSLSTIFGVFPLALGLTEGGELSSPMAVVTFGGLGVSVLLSLYILPMIYYHSELWMEKRSASRGGGVEDPIPSLENP